MDLFPLWNWAPRSGREGSWSCLFSIRTKSWYVMWARGIETGRLIWSPGHSLSVGLARRNLCIDKWSSVWTSRSVYKLTIKRFILFHRTEVVEWSVFPADSLVQCKGTLGKERGWSGSEEAYARREMGRLWRWGEQPFQALVPSFSKLLPCPFTRAEAWMNSPRILLSLSLLLTVFRCTVQWH